jgi:translation initiation factor IF-2
MTTSKEKKPLKLNRPGRLELKKTVETGQVRQSFSHGRSKTVMVEVKRKRTFAPGAEGRMTEVVAPLAAVDQALGEGAADTLEKEHEAAAEAVRHLTQQERAVRLRALESAKLEEEQRRAQEEIEAERRAKEAAEAARLAEEEAKRQAEEATEREAEAETVVSTEAEEATLVAPEVLVAEPAPEPAARPSAAPKPHGKADIEEELGGRVKRKTAVPKPRWPRSVGVRRSSAPRRKDRRTSCRIRSFVTSLCLRRLRCRNWPIAWPSAAAR